MIPTSLKSDAEIQGEVLQELRWAPRVKETDIGVEVDGAVVTLTGTVDSWTARLAAEEAAQIAGVLDIVNAIAVKVPVHHERSDTDIARAARAALEWDVLVPNEQITMTVANGVITLHGKVETWPEFDDAADAVRNLRGVVQVKNHLQVTTPSVSPHTVRSAIDQALARHAAHAAKHVEISISKGTVTLKGDVPSRVEREAVEGAVRGTRGVSKVDSHLHIHH